ncbi:MAG: hypothetical protein HUU02_01545 [Bacteroidetes bacterium]|nr:hypothetical protein [Bacteroidota bacterium]
MIERSIIIVLLLLCTVRTADAQSPAPRFSADTLLMFLPFEDRSGFNGAWKVGRDVPRFAAAYMQQRFRAGVVPPAALLSFAEEQGIAQDELPRIESMRQASERFRTRFIVAGEVTDFSISRFMVSEVQLAGYEAFSAEVRIHFTLYDAQQFGGSRTSILYEGTAEGVVKDRGLGVTLFGKQTDRTNKYFALDQIAFGTEAFMSTIIGEALLQCMDDLGTRLERAIPALVSKQTVLSGTIALDTTAIDTAFALSRRLITGSVVMVDDEDVFINLGSADGVTVGDLLPVFGGNVPVTDPATGAVLGTREERVGEMQIIEVRAEHLSLGLIVRGKGDIKPKHSVRKVFVR